MKKILLLSDTHGFIDDKIKLYANNADEIWHAGDIGEIQVDDELKKIKPLKAVYGNIDNEIIRREFPENQNFKCEDINVWMTHIGGYPNKYSPRIKKIIYDNPPDLFISGHSHILKVINDKKLNLLHINPGAIGNHGFHNVRTMIQFRIDGKKIENLEIIEFKR